MSNIDFNSGNYRTEHVELFWGLTGISGFPIDLNRMSTAKRRRDFPQGISGSHMADDPRTCFEELNIDSASPPPRTFLLKFKGELEVNDMREVDSSHFSGEYYHGQDYSREVFVEYSGQLANCDAIVRYSAPLIRKGEKANVFALMPSAREKLTLEGIVSLDGSNEDPGIIPFGAADSISIKGFPKLDLPPS